MWIIGAEEAHLMEWPEAQRSQLDTQIKDGDVLRASSQLFLQGEKNGLTRRLILKNIMMRVAKM